MKKNIYLFTIITLSLFLMAGTAYAASTIGTSITTGGTLTVGGNIILQNAETISNSSNGTIAITAASTTVSQDFQVLNGGNLRVGAGSTPNLTFNDDDVFVEGTLEVDGNIRLDGNTYFNGYATTTASTGAFATESTITAGGNIILQNAETIANSTNGTVLITAPSTTVSQDFTVTTGGNLRIGTAGTPSTTLDGDDAYIEGTLEVDGNTVLDGTLYVSGALTIGGDLNLQNVESISNSSNGTIAITAASTTVSQDFQVLNGGNLRVGAGSTPNLTFNDDDVFVEGTLEVDGNIRLDGNTYFNGYATTTASTGAFATESTITAGGNIILQNAETIANSTNGTVAITAPSTTVSQDFQVMNGGNLRVGEGGVPSSTFNNDDIYVEGNVELDGNIDIGGSFLIGNVGTPATTLVRLVQPCFAVTQPDDTIWYLWVLNNGHWGTSSTSCMD